jgi:hypothetical protein
MRNHQREWRWNFFSSFCFFFFYCCFSLIDFNATLQVASIFHLLFSPRLSFHTDTTADATQNAVFRVNCCKLLKHRLNGGILLRVSAKKEEEEIQIVHAFIYGIITNSSLDLSCFLLYYSLSVWWFKFNEWKKKKKVKEIGWWKSCREERNNNRRLLNKSRCFICYLRLRMAFYFS